VIPLIQQRKKVAVKERTKVCSIHYPSLVKEEWQTSHAKKKLNKILFIYYLYDKEKLEDSLIKKVELWELAKDKSEIIIQDDWQKTKQKVLKGFAHQLSEKGFKILSPARSGSGGVDKNGEQKDLVFQPNTTYQKKALKRAFTLKQSFTNQLWREINSVAYESILEHLNIKNMDEFEDKVLQALWRFEGKSVAELSEIFEIKIPNGKNQVATIIKKAIGFKNVNAKIKEFEQLGIAVKTIKVHPKESMPIEGVSFSTMKLQEFEEESYDASVLKSYLEKILFIPVYHYGKELNEKRLGKAFFWVPSKEQEHVIQQEWQMYQKEVQSGRCRVEKVVNKSKRGYKEVSQLSKESQTQIIHMRPHARDANDRDSDSHGNSIVKQCFWLNKKFLQKLIQENQ